jgi:hypothetical protein
MDRSQGKVISSTVVGDADGATEGDVEPIAASIRDTNSLVSKARYHRLCKVELELL